MTPKKVTEGKYVFKDDFGKFRMGLGTCQVCGAEDQMCIQYHFNMDPGIPITNWHVTVLKKRTNPVGVTCGCYGKWHRQVAHIRSRRSR